jgi:hypothetical protein
MDKSIFKKLNINQRYQSLKKDGVFFSSREFNGYWVHLYGLSGFYVEVWVLISLDQIRWIEIQENQNQIDLYLNQIKIDNFLK